jgi:sialic acid synthase
MRELTIAGRRISDSDPCYVIAEIGSNHGGDVDVACRMVREAARCGADAVKFQKRTNDTLYTQALLHAPYENENSYGATYGEHRAALEFDRRALERVHTAAKGCGIVGFSTAFDERSVEELASAHFSAAYKIHSGGLTDAPLLGAVAKLKRPVIVSTGGGTVDDIDRAHEILGDCPHAFLHCTAAYPLKPEEANLRCILTLRERYPDTVIGFSSHSPGIALSLVAYAFGARIIEHHFTLNRASKGTDHAFSLEPKALATLVEDLEKTRIAMGDGIKRFYPSEVKPIAKMRRVETPEGWRIAG